MKDANTITKFKMYFSLDKEIAYINEMNQKGWKLVYIKGGCFYTFVKTAPGEYITLLHTETKERLSEVTAFAAQCGYESIPHTMDGFGELLYLTGKRGEVSPEFISDIAQQLESQKRIHKKFFILTIVYYVILAVMLLETLVFFVPAIVGDFTLIPLGIVMAVLTLIFLVMTITVTLITVNIKKRINRLQSDSSIFE